MKTAWRKDEDFLADVRNVERRNDGFTVWWVGQSGFLLHWNGRFLLFDPYLSDSLTRKYAATDKPHVRISERVVAPERLGFVHVVTSSHLHTDHLDPETLRPMARANPDLLLVCPESQRDLSRERSGLLDGRILGLDASVTPGAPTEVPSSVMAGGFEFHAVPAAHEELMCDRLGRQLYLGFIVRFGQWTVYHSGDCVPYPGLAERLREWRIDLALLPINGRAPERRVAGNFTGLEAAVLAHSAGVGCVIPCHYDLFEFNTASPEPFEAICRELGQRYAVLRGGESWSPFAG